MQFLLSLLENKIGDLVSYKAAVSTDQVPVLTFYWMQKSTIYIKAFAFRFQFQKVLKNLYKPRKKHTQTQNTHFNVKTDLKKYSY